MSPVLQSLVALVIVAVAAIGFVVRAFNKRRRPGCEGDCACPSRELKR